MEQVVKDRAQHTESGHDRRGPQDSNENLQHGVHLVPSFVAGFGRLQGIAADELVLICLTRTAAQLGLHRRGQLIRILRLSSWKGAHGEGGGQAYDESGAAHLHVLGHPLFDAVEAVMLAPCNHGGSSAQVTAET